MIDSREVLQGFSGKIVPHKPTFLYKLGLSITAFAMILLPVLYLVMIIGISALLVWHASNFDDIWRECSKDGHVGKDFFWAYIAPLIAGFGILIFMVKPLFAPKQKETNLRSVSRQEEPALFNLIDKLCDLTGAPIPDKVQIDMQVNAYASLVNGPFSLKKKKLSLTIGLPLLAGMNLQMLAGVIAHELGHFSQGTAMRLTYIINSVNFWFARVVYVRDRLDRGLESLSKVGVGQIVAMILLLRFMIFLGRRVLWLLMMVGKIISCFMMRQMEYDADLYEVKIAGSNCFSETSLTLNQLNASFNRSMGELQYTWGQKLLCDDFMGLLLVNQNNMPDNIKHDISKRVMEEKAGYFHTHPSTRDRVAKALAANEPGIFHDNRPASDILVNAKALFENMTRDFYQAMLGDNYRTEYLVKCEDYLKESTLDSNDVKAFQSFYQGMMGMGNILKVDWSHFESINQLSILQAKLAEIRSGIEQILESAGQARDTYYQLVDDKYQYSNILALVEAGFTYKCKEYGKFKAKSKVPTIKINEITEKQNSCLQILQKVSDLFADRIALAVRFAEISGNQDHISIADNIKKHLAVIDALSNNLSQIDNNWLNTGQTLSLLQNIDNSSSKKKLNSTISMKMEEIIKELRAVHCNLKDISFPFEHSTENISVGCYLIDIEALKQNSNLACEVSENLMNNYRNLYFRLLGRLAIDVMKLEAEIG